jgi:hypothetical protein
LVLIAHQTGPGEVSPHLTCAARPLIASAAPALDILFDCGGEHVRLHTMPPTKTVASIPMRRPLLSFGPAA